jgi:hypothetical protein
MRSVAELRAAARRYRRLAAEMTDQRTIDALHQLATEYEASASASTTGSKPEGTDAANTDVANRDHLIRQRAYRLWQQQGCPQGRQADHWRAAERELAEDEPN